MKQQIAHGQADLMGMSADAIAGDIKNGGQVVLAYNNAAALTATRNAAETSMNNYGAGVTALGNLRSELEFQFKQGKVLGTVARDVLKPRLGNMFNQNWVETGFTSSLEIPRSIARLETLLESLTNYYTAHPDFESASSGVTAALLEQAYENLSGLRQSLKGQRTNVRTLARLRREKFTALRNQIRGLAKELTQKLSPLDERWRDYGLNIPGIKQKPGRPAKVSVTRSGSAASLKWNAVARAEYYRVWMRIVGVQNEMVAIGTAYDLDFTIENLPAGATVEIALSAVNNGGESIRSEVVTVAV